MTTTIDLTPCTLSGGYTVTVVRDGQRRAEWVPSWTRATNFAHHLAERLQDAGEPVQLNDHTGHP